MISVLVTYNASPLSRLIRWGTKEPVSHFSICFDQKLMFHSNLFGAHPEFRTTFNKKNHLYKEILIPNTTLEQEEAVYLKCLQFDGRPYDFGALIYFMIFGVVQVLFGFKLPEKNPWQDGNFFLCTEIGTMLDPISNLKFEEDLSIKTPWWLINEIDKRINGKT